MEEKYFKIIKEKFLKVYNKDIKKVVLIWNDEIIETKKRSKIISCEFGVEHFFYELGRFQEEVTYHSTLDLKLLEELVKDSSEILTLEEYLEKYHDE